MNDLNIDKLEHDAIARAYNTNKPDELNDNTEETHHKTDMSFFKISKLINVSESKIEPNHFLQCFRYIKMIDCDWSCHLSLLLNYTVGLLIPAQYVISYNDSLDNNVNIGKVKFKDEKEYEIGYEKITKEEFVNRMHELETVSLCVEKFENNNQIFYEFQDSYIYMYYEGYAWKITGYSRNNIKEYYHMYTILMSIRKLSNKNYQDNNNLKLIYLINKNCLNYLYQGVDLKKKSYDEINAYSLGEDVVTFSIDNNRYLTVLDEDYQIFNRKIKDNNEDIEKIKIYSDDKWYFKGSFKASILGIYSSGYILDFPEIIDSTELNQIEKRDLLENIMNQKQIELYEYKDLIVMKLLNIIIDGFRKQLTVDIWNDLELVNYLYIEDIDIENKTEELVYDFLRFTLDNGDDEIIKKLIDIEYLSSKIKPLNVVIGSEFIVFSCNIFNHNKTFVLFENNEFIEWQ